MASHHWIVGGEPLGIALAALALSWPAAASAGPLDRWSAEIAAASSRFGVPEEWIRRVMRAESNGRTLADGRPIVSPAGAMGLMQLMPGTWRDMRLALGLGPDPHDPADNIAAGTFYLRLMYERFGYPGLFAAYNAGPARYADFLSGRRALPSETLGYVAAVAPVGSARPEVPRQPTVTTGSAISSAKAPALAAGTLWPTSRGLFAALDSSTRR